MTLPRRAELGQFFTPGPVADLTVALARDGARGGRVLDPSCGDGVFLARGATHGVDVDPAAVAAARARAPDVDVACADFLALPPPDAPFDAVVGNPPYIRQEALGAARKAAIGERLRADWGVAWPARADLAAAFVARALRFVRPGGRVAFVLSTATLDAGYGDTLRAFLRGRGVVRAVVVSPRERWFADAAIHAAIVVIERIEEGAVEPPTLLARLRVPVADAAARVRRLDDLASVADVRHERAGVAWSTLLRAPDAWFTAVAAAGPALVPLETLAELWRGTTSGANEFFYLSRAEAQARGLERRFLRPLLKTPRAAAAPRIDVARLDTLAFCCELDAPALAAFPAAAAHVRAHAALAERPSLRPRRPWWTLPARPAQVFLTKAYHERFVQPFADEPLVADQRVYALAPRDPALPPALLAAVLNGSLTALAIESLGRASMGQGALELSVGDAQALPVLDARVLAADAGHARRALESFAALAARPGRPVAGEATAPDRVALDDALAAPWPALARAMGDVRAALVETVAARRERSRRS